MNWRRYAQLIGPLLGAVVMTVVLAIRGASEDNVITGPEWVLGVTQVLMVVSVWGAANVRGWEVGKKVQAAIFAVLALLAAVVTGSISGDEWLQLIITGLSALGVVAISPTPLAAGATTTRQHGPSGLRY